MSELIWDEVEFDEILEMEELNEILNGDAENYELWLDTLESEMV